MKYMSDALKFNEHYTYSDYIEWDDGNRYELIDGTAYMMSAPAWEHQSISGALHNQFYEFFKGKPCRVFHAPFDVRLNATQEDDIVVQPDIVIICDRSKLTGTGCAGAPDMVVEILSPTTARFDRLVKFKKYLEAGVREYWIVDPETHSVQDCVLENGRYVVTMYADTDEVPVNIFKPCKINLQDVFESVL
jgi:Uma2 family endonuclease